MKIKSLKRVPGSKKHIDITVQKNHNFFANGILTHNCNLPARNVVIAGTHRGLNEVDPLDFTQMGGRAGRFGIDDEGHVFFVVPNGSQETYAYQFRNPRAVVSVLKNHNTLMFHVLAEVWSGNISSIDDMFQWYKRSLAYKQDHGFTKEDAERLINDLLKMDMVEFVGDRLTITNLGKVSAILYYPPGDVYAWYKGFDELFNNTYPVNDVNIAYAIANRPEYIMEYTPKDIQNEVYEYLDMVKKNHNFGKVNSSTGSFTTAAYFCITGAEDINGMSVFVRAIRYDIDRMVQAMKMIDDMYAKWDKRDFWNVLSLRVRYGVPKEMIELVKIKGVGGKRAKNLWNAGIKTTKDVANKKNLAIMINVFRNKVTATKVQNAARSMLKESDE